MPAADQPQKSLVNQRGGLQWTGRPLPPQMRRRKLFQLVIDERNNRVQRLPFTRVDALQHLRQFHNCSARKAFIASVSIKVRSLPTDAPRAFPGGRGRARPADVTRLTRMPRAPLYSFVGPGEHARAQNKRAPRWSKTFQVRQSRVQR